VHPTGGSRRVFKPFAWLEVGSSKAASSRPACLRRQAHPRVTLTVGTLLFGKSFVLGYVWKIVFGPSSAELYHIVHILQVIDRLRHRVIYKTETATSGRSFDANVDLWLKEQSGDPTWSLSSAFPWPHSTLFR
jgi:hypothetical protein